MPHPIGISIPAISIRAVHHIPFPGKREREFPVSDKVGEFPEGWEQEFSENGTGFGKGPWIPVSFPFPGLFYFFYSIKLEMKYLLR